MGRSVACTCEGVAAVKGLAEELRRCPTVAEATAAVRDLDRGERWEVVRTYRSVKHGTRAAGALVCVGLLGLVGR